MFGHKALAPTRSFPANAGDLSKHLFLDVFAFVSFCQSVTVLCAFVTFSQSLNSFAGAFKGVFNSIVIIGGMQALEVSHLLNIFCCTVFRSVEQISKTWSLVPASG